MTTITPSGITTGYTTTISGVLYDLGDLFAAPTTVSVVTNYQRVGADLSTKFAQYSTSLLTPPFITGYKINGIDISQICILHPLTNVLNGTNITTTISGTTYTVNVEYSSSAPTFNFKLISPTVSGTLYGGQAGGGGGTSIPTTTFNTTPTTNTTVSIVTGSGGAGYQAAYTIPMGPLPPIHTPAFNAAPGQATTITFNSAATPSYSTGTSSVINSSGTANGASGHATLIFTPF